MEAIILYSNEEPCIMCLCLTCVKRDKCSMFDKHCAECISATELCTDWSNPAYVDMMQKDRNSQEWAY